MTSLPWKPARAAPPLAASEVHVWVAVLDALPVGAYIGLLSPDEAGRADRRALFLASRRRGAGTSAGRGTAAGLLPLLDTQGGVHQGDGGRAVAATRRIRRHSRPA